MTVSTFIDVKKAFDTVHAGGLTFKLIGYNINKNLIKLLHSFLAERRFVVRCGSAVSNTFQCLTGVPQGSALSPLLYNVFLSDFPRPEAGAVKQLAYADDVVVFAKSIHIKGMEMKFSCTLSLLIIQKEKTFKTF